MDMDEDDKVYGVRIALVNEDEGCLFSEWTERLDDPYGAAVNDDGTPNMGRIYRVMQEEYGRCDSSIYVDQTDGPPRRVGWYFTKRNHYDRSPADGTYLQGAWVTVVELVAEATPERWGYVS